MRISGGGEQLRQPVQGLGSENDVHVWGASAYGLALLAGDATPNAQDQFWIRQFPAAPSAQFRKEFFFRLFTDGAGIKQDDVGVVRIPGQFHTLRVREQI